MRRRFETLMNYFVSLVTTGRQLKLKLAYYNNQDEIYFLSDGEKVLVGGRVATVNMVSRNDGKLWGTIGHDILGGDDRNNSSYAIDGHDSIFAFGGNDLVYGGAGADFILAGRGNDTVLGGADNDYIGGDDGNDRLYGEAGNDEIWGGDGNDFLYGGSGANTLSGEGGNDVLFVESGRDTAAGGDGTDTLNLSRVKTAVTGASWLQYTGFFLYADNKEKGFGGINSLVSTQRGVNEVSGFFSKIENIIGTPLDDRIQVLPKVEYIDAGYGNDMIEISAEDVSDKPVILRGGNGDDIYRIEFGAEGSIGGRLTIQYTEGRDRVVIANSNEVTVYRNGSDLLINVQVGKKISIFTVENGWGAFQTGQLNVLWESQKDSGASSTSVVGNPPSVYLSKTGFFPAELTGGNGADLLSNATGSYNWFSDGPLDSIYQNSLCTMTGGKGADNFLLWSGGVIKDFDFKDEKDTLVFAKEIFGSLDAVKKLTRRQFNGDLVIETPWKIPAGAPNVNQPITLQLLGVTNAEFNAALANGHVRVDSLAGVTAASLRF